MSEEAKENVIRNTPPEGFIRPVKEVEDKIPAWKKYRETTSRLEIQIPVELRDRLFQAVTPVGSLTVSRFPRNFLKDLILPMLEFYLVQPEILERIVYAYRTGESEAVAQELADRLKAEAKTLEELTGDM